MRLVLLATALVAGSTLAAAPARAETLAWQPCPEGAQVQCATVTVPIDHAHPETGTIDVAIGRRPATDPAHRIGVLFLMPGGPGGSGVDDLYDESRLPAELATRFDLVSFDPRGTNRSHPVRCDEELLAAQPNFAPVSGTTLATVRAYSRALGESCREHTGPLIDFIDNVSVARDIDVIRAALGERKLSLFGGSYGTLTGQMYAERFPHRIRAMLLDSLFDHSLALPEFVLSGARTGEDSFREFASWCAVDPTCVLHGQDVGQLYGDLFERTGDPLGLTIQMNAYLAGPRWHEAAEFLKSGNRARQATPFPIAPLCADHRFRFSSEREWRSLWDRQRLAAPTMRAYFAWAFVPFCADWPARVGNPQHHTDVTGAPPVMLLNSLHDPASGIEWARSVNRQLRGSVLLTYDGWGHDTVMRSECTRRAATAYLVDRVLPRPGTHCPAEQGVR